MKLDIPRFCFLKSSAEMVLELYEFLFRILNEKFRIKVLYEKKRCIKKLKLTSNF